MQFDRLVLERSLASLVNATVNTTPPDASIQLSVPAQMHLFETVDSTNRRAWDLLQQGSPTGTVVIALQQTAGRGQRGHQWRSPPGGLYLSLALTPDLTAECGTHLTMASAWGIASALRRQGVPVGIKWLNDLVIDTRKLGGILTETRLAHQRIRQAVIGVGINWQNPVPQGGTNLQTVLAAQVDPSIRSLEHLAAVVIAGLIQGYSAYRQLGVEPLLNGYHSLLTSLGRSVMISGDTCAGLPIPSPAIPGTAVPGTVIGVSPQGELRVQLEGLSGAAAQVLLKPGEFSLGY